MTIDKILSSLDASRPDLDATVKQFREMGAAMELVLADHFDVEDLATGVEQLAARLANIRDVLTPHLGSVSIAGDLARAIDAITLPAGDEPAIARVEAVFSGDQDYTFSITERRLYGHPDLRHVFRYGFDPLESSRTHANYLVRLPSGSVFEVRREDTVFAAADAPQTRFREPPQPAKERSLGAPQKSSRNLPSGVLAGGQCKVEFSGHGAVRRWLSRTLSIFAPAPMTGEQCEVGHRA